MQYGSGQVFRRFAPFAGAAAALLAGVAAPAQSAPAPSRDSVTVVAGAEYAASGLQRRLFGDDYRDLWTTPFRVAVLDLDTFAGGLEPEQKGGGLQTKSLRFRGGDDREYTFRSVAKWPYLAQGADLENTTVGDIIQDQVSALNPAAALVAAPLLEAAGVLHVRPQLRVMPDDPRLGEYREEFAGMLGLIEERPDEIEEEDGEERPGFAGSAKIVGTETLLDNLEDDAEHRLDAAAYLRARIMDLILGDWDRHAGQWRWARFDRDGLKIYQPIPRDRDYALVNFDGLLLGAGRGGIPNAVRFGGSITDLGGLTMNATNLDRRLLSELGRPVWEATAADLQRRLTDAVITDAVRQLPPEFYALRGNEIEQALRERRDDLARAAGRFYERLSYAVDVHSTDEDELALVDRQPDGSVDVRIFEIKKSGVADEPLFQRRFLPSETSEVRLFLHGGDDRATVRGDVTRSIVVRIVGGGGDDVLADSARVRSSRGGTALYDARGDNQLLGGAATSINERSYETPDAKGALVLAPFRDWGASYSVTPSVGYRTETGVVLGAGPAYTRYGFRYHPFKYRLGARGAYAFGSRGFLLEGTGDFRRANSGLAGWAELRGSQISSLRFHGFGNATDASGDNKRFLVERDDVFAAAAVRYFFAPARWVSAGPAFRYTDLEGRGGSPLEALDAYGNDDSFRQAGMQIAARWDNQDQPELPRSGFRLSGSASAYPGWLDAREAFGDLNGEAVTYLSAALPSAPTLALRAGGKWVWGGYPLHEAAFLGGSSTLRGYSSWRFAGDAAAYGSAELRNTLTRAKLFVRGDLGGLLFSDFGRVFYDGDADGADSWHSSFGGGLWFAFRFRDAPTTFSLVYGHGEDGRIYARIGLPF